MFITFIFSAGALDVDAYIIFCVRPLQVCSFYYDGQCEGLKAWNGQRYGSHAFLYNFHWGTENLPHLRSMNVLKEFFKENFQKNSSPKKSDKPRIEFIDLAKGFCIILVVLMHNGFTRDLPIIKALRMPLYFVLSGLFFKDYGRFLGFILKKTNRLLIPLLFFISVEIIIRLFLSPSGIISDLLRPFSEPVMINFPTWFLLCLFWVNLFYYFVHTKFQSILSRCIIVLILGGIGAALSYYDIYLPLYMSSAFSATPFFFVGIMLGKLPILYQTNHEKALLALGIVLLIASTTYCVLTKTPNISFMENLYKGNYIEIFLVSVSTVIGFLLLCKAIKWLPIISYIGRYSIIVLGMHIVFRNYAYLPIHAVTHHTFSRIEVLALSLILCWISIPFIKKIFPKFCAQDDLLPLRKRQRSK